MDSSILTSTAFKGLLVCWGVALLLLSFVAYLKSTARDAPKLRSIAVVLMTYSIAAWVLISLVYVPYHAGLAPTMSRHYTFVPLTAPGAHRSLVFHSALAAALVVLGTFFGVRLWRSRAEP